MGISVNDSAVARWSGSPAQSAAITSGAFTPANNSLLVVCVNWDESSAPATHVVSGGGLSWTQRVERNVDDAGSGALGGAAIWTAPVTTGASMQVTVTRNADGNESDQTYSAKCYIVTGQAASPIGATAENAAGWDTANSLNAPITATGAGRLFGCATDWTAAGLPSSNDTEDAGHSAGLISYLSAYKASDHSAGAQTINFNAFGSANAQWNWVLLEILAATATTINITDSGGGSDAIGQIAAALALSDAGAGVDGFSGRASLALADSGAMADSLVPPRVILQLADAGAAGDLIQFVRALLLVADSGAGIDQLSIAANLSVADAGVGSDTAAAYVLIQVSDAGAAADAVTRIAVALSIADSGAGGDALAQILASLALSDSGAGVDSITIAQGGDVKTINDAATGADLVGGVSVSLTLADAGAAADMVAQVFARLSVSDAGLGADTAAAITFLAHGKIRITFTARRPGATIIAKRPGMAMTARRPGVTFH